MTGSGIYQILNTVDGKRYIGSAVNMQSRWWMHLCELRANKHGNSKLQRGWNKHGEQAFNFLPILTCAKSMLLNYEQQLLDKVKPEYNICVVAGSALGVKRSAEFKAKLLGHPVSDETRQKMRAAKLGKKQTPEQVARRVAGLIGRTVSDTTKAKIGAKNAGHAAARSALITHCPVGHEYSEVNTYISKKNQRGCRICSRDRMRVKRAAKHHGEQ